MKEMNSRTIALLRSRMTRMFYGVESLKDNLEQLRESGTSEEATQCLCRLLHVLRLGQDASNLLQAWIVWSAGDAKPKRKKKP